MKIGDKVRVAIPEYCLLMEGGYTMLPSGLTLNKNMLQYNNKIATIVDMAGVMGRTFMLDIDGGKWIWDVTIVSKNNICLNKGKGGNLCSE